MFGESRSNFKPSVEAQEAIAEVETFVTRAELEELKNGFNDSMSEVANLFLEVQAGVDNLKERLELFNRRSGQKI